MSAQSDRPVAGAFGLLGDGALVRLAPSLGVSLERLAYWYATPGAMPFGRRYVVRHAILEMDAALSEELNDAIVADVHDALAQWTSCGEQRDADARRGRRVDDFRSTAIEQLARLARCTAFLIDCHAGNMTEPFSVGRDRLAAALARAADVHPMPEISDAYRKLARDVAPVSALGVMLADFATHLEAPLSPWDGRCGGCTNCLGTHAEQTRLVS